MSNPTLPRTHEQPNVLLLVADQLRADHLGYAGAAHVRTPNIDGLAAAGTRFSRCYTNAPICAPARISLATGRDPWTLDAHDNAARLPEDADTVYRSLRDDGYRVGLVGKADLDKPDRWHGLRGDRPQTFRWGFTHPCEVEGKMQAAYAPVPIGPYGAFLAERGLYDRFYEDYAARRSAGWVGATGWADSALPDELFADRYVGVRAGRWIEEITNDYPWFLQVGFVGPHDPYDPPADVGERYRTSAVPSAVPATAQESEWVRSRAHAFSDEEIETARRQYAAAIEILDEEVGRILAALDATGRRDDTIVIFTADHGDLLGDHGLFAKTAPYEGAARVPLVVAGPGVSAGAQCESLVELADLCATICELVGASPPDGMNARSFATQLDDPAAPHRDAAVLAATPFDAIVSDRHKLIRSDGGFVELYDLEADPGETTNLAEREHELVERLRARLDDRIGTRVL